MRMILIDDQDRQVLTGHIDITDFHIKIDEDQDEFFGNKLLMPSRPRRYSTDLKFKWVEKQGVALSLYPDRVKDAGIEVKTCSTINGAPCCHEHRRSCFLHGADRSRPQPYAGITIDCGCE